MKKHVLLMIMVLMSLNVVAQEMEEFFGCDMYGITNVVHGEKEECWYITKVEPYSQVDMAGLRAGDLLTSSDTVNNVYHVGGSKQLVNVGSYMELEKDSYLTELEVMDKGKTKYGLVGYRTWNSNPFIYKNTQVYSDPEVSLYDYSTFDFEFTENNVIQQKEISGIIEKELNKKNLKWDKDNPDVLIFINYYSDRRENYTPPTQEIITRYKYGYEIGSGWGTRQYIESQTRGGYTKVLNLIKFTITMLDAEKVRKGCKVPPIIWNADFEVPDFSVIPPLKPFCADVAEFMFCQFPIVHPYNQSISKKRYYQAVGLLFEKKKPKVIYHVLKGSPAEKAGLKAGDEFVKYGKEKFIDEDSGNTSFDMLIKRKNGKKETIHFDNVKSYEVLDIQ